MGSSSSHLAHANYVNALPNPNALFDTAAKLYGIKPETVWCEIQLKPEIIADTQLLEWLAAQLKATMNTRDAMGVLKCNLHQARALGLILRDGHGDEADRAETLEKLNNLEAMRSGLDEFLKLVCNQQGQLKTVLDDLRRREHDLDHKHGRIKARGKAWNIAQCIAKFVVTVLSVVFPVAGVRPVATAVNNGVSGVIGLLQPLVESYLAGQQRSCEVEIDLTAKILNEACFIFHRVNSVRVLVEELQVKMGSLAEYAEFLAVAAEFLFDRSSSYFLAVDEIKVKAGELVDIIQNLEKEVDLSCDDLRRAALTLLQVVTDQVGNSDQQVSIEIRT